MWVVVGGDCWPRLGGSVGCTYSLRIGYTYSLVIGYTYYLRMTLDWWSQWLGWFGAAVAGWPLSIHPGSGWHCVVTPRPWKCLFGSCTWTGGHALAGWNWNCLSACPRTRPPESPAASAAKSPFLCRWSPTAAESLPGWNSSSGSSFGIESPPILGWEHRSVYCQSLTGILEIFVYFLKCQDVEGRTTFGLGTWEREGRRIWVCWHNVCWRRSKHWLICKCCFYSHFL